MNITQIAQICHEANKAYCETIDDYSQKSWLEADQWQRDSAVKGVQFAVANPGLTPKDQHDSWMLDKVNSGWIYGEVKDPELKTHPCIVPYFRLPKEQKLKDYIFRGIVKAFIEIE